MVLWSAFGFTAAVSTTGLDKLTKEIIPSAWFYPRDEYLLSGVSPLLTSLKVAPFVGLLIVIVVFITHSHCSGFCSFSFWVHSR